jgi:hypothetical protein
MTYISNVCTQSPILVFRKEENKTYSHIQEGKNQRQTFKGHIVTAAKLREAYFPHDNSKWQYNIHNTYNIPSLYKYIQSSTPLQGPEGIAR